ncbi:hypothetical protein [Acidovorax sp.]|uniref:hypothetical protein n=1 Tax=Acidovorax sp. TaxID=1872122 RepID=UPI002ACD9B4A|nr:hypothetical protein [Acidovorax sp.]MDZ7862419.1 hypothetical protein [Acidovorax sp.]
MGAEFINTCASCGAEESIDALLGRMIDDEEARHLVADVISMSLPLGRELLRYLRLFKPEKQRLRMSRAKAILAELVPDMTATAITRGGRTFLVTMGDWQAGFHAVFAAIDKGTLAVPLAHNNYLYTVVTRTVDRTEALAEADQELQRRVAPLRGVVQVDQKAPVQVGAALLSHLDPALLDLQERDRQAAGPSEEVRAKMAKLLGKAPAGGPKP